MKKTKKRNVSKAILLKVPKIQFKLTLKFIKYHVLAAISLIPMIIGLWLAMPNISFQFNDTKTISFFNLQPFKSINQQTGESEIYRPIAFDKNFELQGGTVLKLTFDKPIDENQKIDVVDDSDSGDTELKQSDNENTQNAKDTFDEKVDETISIIRQRLLSSSLSDSYIYKLNSEDNPAILITLSRSREELGILPYYLILQASDVQIWVDNPNYDPEKDNNDGGFNLLAGMMPSGLTKDDIKFAQAINSEKTTSRIGTSSAGLKIVFKTEAIEKIQNATQNFSRFGFALVIDGQPVAFLSSAYNPRTPNILYFTDIYGFADIDAFRLIASDINNPSLPIKASINLNNNSSSLFILNVDLLKIVLFIFFVIVLLFFTIRFRVLSIISNIVLVNTLIISIALFKLFNQELSLQLILGVTGGLGIVAGILYFILKEFESMNFVTSSLIIEKRKEFIKIVKNLSLFILFLTILISNFSLYEYNNLAIGLGIIILINLISFWTVFITFSNEIIMTSLYKSQKR